MRKSSMLLTLLLLVACRREAAAPPVPLAAPAARVPASAPLSGSAAPPPAPVEAGVPAPAAAAAQLTFRALELPGATAPVSLDYIAYERSRARVWVPVGDTGSVDVYDTAAGTFARVDGFPKIERERNGKKRMMGPSSVSMGDGVAYVGDRGSSEVCVVDAGALKLGKCLKLPSPPDGIEYVASVRELWVTTPHDSSLTVLDASTSDSLKPKAIVKLPGSPEGYAVDEAHGLFFTNLEDHNQTLVIDIRTRKTKASWKPGCDSDGPRGIAADVDRGFVLVACTDRVVVLDGAHDGATVGKLDVGPGVDNIDWLASERLLYVGAARAAKLVVARVDERGQLTVAASADIPLGARNPVADPGGNAYLTDAMSARLLVFGRPR